MESKVVAVLTGRGNSTLKDKNVLDVLGHPVLHYPAKACIDSGKIDHFFCSSDDEKILLAAENEGFQRIVRPAELATSTAQHIDCIKHALAAIEDRGISPDIVVVVLANNATLKSKWVADCIELMESDPSLTAVVPVYEDNDHHPLRAKSLGRDGLLEMYEKDVVAPISTNRQDLPPCYFIAHNIWVLRASYLKSGAIGQQPWSFMGDRIAPYVIDESIDIHDEDDLVRVKAWLSKNAD